MKRIAIRTAIAIAALVLAGLAPGTGNFVPAVRADSADPQGPKCMCRYQGRRYGLGEFACINSKLARCDMFLNNTSWTFLEDTCPTAQLRSAPRTSPVVPVRAHPNG